MDLKIEVQNFKKWAENQPQNSGEWEMDYPEWPSLLAAVEKTLSRPTIDGDDVDLLLYALARDNECESIGDMLKSAPERGIMLAKAAVTNPDPHARWQLAAFLGTRVEAEAIVLLRQFIEDDNEYVCRRALLAMKQHDTVFAEETAKQWIDSPHEYTRLAALSVLHDLESPYLKSALERLRADPF